MRITRTAAITTLAALTVGACSVTEAATAPASSPAPVGVSASSTMPAATEASAEVTGGAPVPSDARRATTPATVPATIEPAVSDSKTDGAPVAARPGEEPPPDPPVLTTPSADDPTPAVPGTPPTRPTANVTIAPTIAVAVDPPVTVPPIIGTPVVLTCPFGGDLPGNATSMETLLVDLDDDGQSDTVTSYFVALGDSAGWRLRAELAGGPTSDVPIEGVSGVGVAQVLGGVQVDFDIADPDTFERELLVRAGANASGVNLAVFGIDASGCLFRFEDGAGDDLVLPVHGSIGVKSGVMCDNIDGTAFLARLEAEHTQDSHYAATWTALDRDGDALVDGALLAYDIDAGTQAGWLDQFGDVNCAGIEL